MPAKKQIVENPVEESKPVVKRGRKPKPVEPSEPIQAPVSVRKPRVVKQAPPPEEPVKSGKVPRAPKEPRPVIIKQVIQKQKKAPTQYNMHIAKEVKAGKSFKEAVGSWQELKKELIEVE